MPEGMDIAEEDSVNEEGEKWDVGELEGEGENGQKVELSEDPMEKLK